MPKVLIHLERWAKGGIENFVIGVLPQLVNEGYEFDISSVRSIGSYYDSQLSELGVRRSVAFPDQSPSQITRLMTGLKRFKRLLSDGNYDAVWIAYMTGTSFLYSMIAKQAGVPIRIVHSHGTDVGEGAKKTKRLISHTLSKYISGSCNSKLACSREAGLFMFQSDDFIVVHNGIDIQRFRFNLKSRVSVREKLGVPCDAIFLGNIGRVAIEKNPIFQLEVFNCYLDINPNAYYLMMGTDEMLTDVKAFVVAHNLQDRVILREAVSDTAPYYSALDLFLMPSIREGVSFSQIEAQCSGLPVLCSDGISSEADITDLCVHCKLSEGFNKWSKTIDSMLKEHASIKRDKYAELVKRAGYSLEDTSNTISAALAGKFIL